MTINDPIKDALEKIFSGINQLRAAIPNKEFTIDGRLVGDIGEAIAQRDYELRLYETLVKGYDAETPDGRRVQIKATFQNMLTFRKVPDYYLGLKIFNDGTYIEIFNGPGKIIAERYKHRKGFEVDLLSFPNAVLEELSASVKSDQRIQLKHKKSRK